MTRAPETSSTPESSASPRQTRRPKRLRRWVIRLVVLVFVLLLLLLGIQLILWSDLPRRIVANAASRATGLDVRIGSLDVHWNGGTVARDVEVRVPLEDEPLLLASSLRVEHAWLPILAAKQVRGVSEIELEGLHAFIREDADGRWNVLDAAETLRTARAHKPAKGPPSIPAVRIAGAKVTVERHGHQAVQLPLEFEGSPSQPSGAAWRFEADLAGMLAEGRFAVAGFAHEVTINATVPPELLALVVDDGPQVVTANASWRGRVSGGSLVGTLDIAEARLDDRRLKGQAEVAADAGSVRSDRFELAIADPLHPQGPIRVEGEGLRASADGVELWLAEAEGFDHAARVSATWDARSREGLASVVWSGRVEGAQIEHAGRTSLQVTRDAFGLVQARADFASSGQAEGRTWESRGRLEGSGSDLDSIAGRVSFSTLTLRDPERGPADLAELQAAFGVAWPIVEVTSLDHPLAEEPRVAATFNFDDSTWTLDASTASIEVPDLGEVAVRIAAAGSPEEILFEHLAVHREDLELTASGKYRPGDVKPIQAEATFAAKLPVVPEDEDPERLVRQGEVRGGLRLSGSISPLAFEASGKVRTSGVRLRDRDLDDLEFDARGTVDSTRAALKSSPIPMFGGDLTISATHDVKANETVIGWVGANLDLELIAKAFPQAPEIRGRAGLQGFARAKNRDFASLMISGNWEITEAGVAQADKFMTDDIDVSGNFALRDGELLLDEIEAASGPGRATGVVRLRPLEGGPIEVGLSVSDWPVVVPEVEASARAGGRIDLVYEPQSKAVYGAADLAGDLTHSEAELGAWELRGRLDTDQVTVEHLNAAILGGTVQGEFRAPFADWTLARGTLEVRDVDLGRAANLHEQVSDLRGVLNGSILIQDGRGERSPGPLRVSGELVARDASIRGLQFGDVGFEAFAGPSGGTLQDLTVQVAGGEFGAWGRLSFHDGEPFVFVNVSADDMVLEQLLAVAGPEAPPAKGVLRAEGSFGGYLRAPHRTFGEAEVAVAQADLGRVPLVSELYGLLNLSLNAEKAQGRGVARIRLEDDALVFPDVRYFNQGADIIANARIENIFDGKKSPLSGVAAAAVRPLRDNALPFSGQFDRATSAITGAAVSVRIDGTLESPTTQTVPFRDVTSIFQRILGRGSED